MDAEHGLLQGKKTDSEIHVGCVYARMCFYSLIVAPRGSHMLHLRGSFLPKRVEIASLSVCQCQQRFQVPKLQVVTQI